MKKQIALCLSLLLLAGLTACGQDLEPGSSIQGGPHVVPPKSEWEPGTEITVADACSDEGSYQYEGFEADYSYHIPEIQSDAPGAGVLNEEIQNIYADLVLNSQQADEIPECWSIGYRHYQNGDVLTLVIQCSYGYGGLSDYIVYNYDAEKDSILERSDIAALLGVGEKALQNAVTRAAAQAFDDTFHSMEEWREGPNLFQYYRAETLSEDYLSQAIVYLGEGGQPRAIFPLWTYGDPGMYFCDRPLEPSPGKGGRLEDPLLDVSWDNTGVAIRFHGSEANRDFWGEEYGCGWLLEYDKNLPVAGLYSNYTQAFLYADSSYGRPVLFLLTDQGRVEYVDLASCMQGGYLCGGGPLLGVENATGFAKEPFSLYAECKDGSEVDLFEALVESWIEVPEPLTGSWETVITHRWASGESEDIPYTLTLHMDGWLEYQAGSEYMDRSVFDPLGVTEDGVVYQYRLYHDDGGESDGVPYCGTVAFRGGYDPDTWEEVLYVTTLSVDVIGILDDTPGAVTRMNRAAAG